MTDKTAVIKLSMQQLLERLVESSVVKLKAMPNAKTISESMNWSDGLMEPCAIWNAARNWRF